jgi:uncharacterized integral membrane protein
MSARGALALVAAEISTRHGSEHGISVSFLFWTMSMPKIVLILGTYLIGMLSGWGLVVLIKRAF